MAEYTLCSAFQHNCVCVHVCLCMYMLYVCAHVNVPPLNDNRVEVSEAHDDIQRDRGVQVISIQTQVPEAAEQALQILLEWLMTSNLISSRRQELMK